MSKNFRFVNSLWNDADAAFVKKGLLAYDVSKAAQSRIVRAIGVAPATVVRGLAMFPRDRVIGTLAKCNIPYIEEEATKSSVKKLAQFFADRMLTRTHITPVNRAEVYFLPVLQRLTKTTG
jgi:hypothetical protein